MANNIDLELLKLEINARLEEYKALRAEIVATLGAAFQTTTLTLTAIGTLIGSSPFIIKYERPVLFIAASFVFYVLAWTQLRYGLVIYGLSQHIIETVSPGIRKALELVFDQVDKPNHLNEILCWEQQGRTRIHPKEKWTFPIEAARYGVPLGAGLLSSIAYLLNVIELRNLDKWDWLLFASSIAFLFYTGFLTLTVRSVLSGNKKSKAAESLSSQSNQPILSNKESPRAPITTTRAIINNKPDRRSKKRK